MNHLRAYLLLGSLLLSTVSLFAQKKNKPVRLSERTFGAIEARHIGPAVMSGRVATLDAVASDPRILYVGAAGGGVWKSENAGVTFEPIFEKYPQSIGAITIDQAHPDTVWVGTGEPWTRNSTSVGKGIFRSYNGGDNWKFVGLPETERIGKILIHPEDPNTVYVAALGHLWGPNEERGLFRTKDGGKTWEKILFVDENTGCSSIAFDPQDPQVLYAGMWDFRRQAWTFRSGGEGSSLHVSRDGGDSWEKASQGLPGGTLGRICLEPSKLEPYPVYALIESEESGLYKTLDQGKSWARVSDNPVLGERPFYFSLIVADPQDSARLYKPGFSLAVSKDGGENWSGAALMGGGNFHSDVHALWIDPNNNQNIYLGTDGGVYRSNDQAKTWTHIRSLPISQFYHVSADMQRPYHVYGGLQDNGSWAGPSRSPGGIGNADWQSIGFGDGFVMLPDPTDDDIVYWESQGGNIVRYYRSTAERKSIKPYASASDERLRFNWDTPIYFGHGESPALYVGSQFLFRSKDRGDSWEKISPDLTTDDPEKQRQEESGGLTIDNSTAENHCTIICISESPLDDQVIWVGTDDGNLQVSRDGGKTWANVADKLDPDLPAKTWVSSVEASRFSAGTAYVTLDGHRNNDKTPYVFKTEDFGQSWTNLAKDSKIESYCHVIKEDLQAAHLLFLGTEMGLYLSIDGGKKWIRFNGNVPKVAIHDMFIHPKENDLILATHGRGIMIVDDLTPIREIDETIIQQDLAFLNSRPFKLQTPSMIQRFPGDDEFTGSNPSSVAIITYYLKKRHIFGDMSIEVFDEEGQKLAEIPAGKRKGINRVSWNVRRKAPKVPRAKSLAFQAAFGPTLPPGSYTIKLKKDEETYTHTITLIEDPDSRHSAADLEANRKAVTEAYDLIEELAWTERQLREMRDQAKARAEVIKNKKLKASLESLADESQKLRDMLVPSSGERIAGQIRLRERLAEVYGNMSSYQGRPTDSQIESLASLKKEISEINIEIDKIQKGSWADLNAQLIRKKLEPMEIISKEAYDLEGQSSGGKGNFDWERLRMGTGY